MKNLFKFLFVLAILSGSATFSQVGIGTTTPAASAMLDVTSTTKGFLPPRMTSTQMNAITAPAVGLMVYCTNCSPKGLYTSTGSVWEAAGASSGATSSSGGVSATMVSSGNYIWGATHTGRTVVITVSNQSFNTISWTNAAADLVISGGNTGLTVGTPTAGGGGTSSGVTTTIAAGGTGTITFSISGAVGTMDDITFTWTKFALTVVGTQTVTAGSATFTNLSNAAFVFSANASGVNVAGSLPVGTTVTLPYTAGVGNYAAIISDDVAIPSVHCADGASNWTFGYSIPAGTFAASGSITATLITKKAGIITAWPATQVTDISTINSLAAGDWLRVNNTICFIGVDPVFIGVDYGGDAIRGKLTTSATAYDAAAAGDWIAITNAEYNILQNSANISGAGTYMLNNTTMNINCDGGPSGDLTIAIASTTPTSNFTAVPTNNYIYAFRFKSSNSTFASANPIIRYNASSANGSYSTLGTSNSIAGRLPSVTGTSINTFYSFVIKRPSQKTSSSSPTFVSIYLPSGANNYLGSHTNSSTGMRYNVTGNASNMSAATTLNVLPSYQVLATPTKSW